CAPGTSGTLRGASSCERLLVRRHLEVDVHADALVEMRSAGGVLRVDAERDTAEAALVEVAEAVVEQRLREPAAAIRATYAECVAPLAAVPVRVVAGARGDLAVLVVADDEPGRRVVPGLRALLLPPLVEVARVVLPVVLERFLECRVERARVLLAERLERQALWPRRRGRRPGERDRHLVERPHPSEAVRLEERDGILVPGEHAELHARQARLPRATRRRVDDRRAEPTPARLGIDHALDVSELVAA